MLGFGANLGSFSGTNVVPPVFDRTTNRLFFAYDDKVLAYQISPTSGAIGLGTPVTVAPGGCTIDKIAFDPIHSRLYILRTVSGVKSLAVHDFDSNSGLVNPAASSTLGAQNTADIAVTTDGEYLYSLVTATNPPSKIRTGKVKNGILTDLGSVDIPTDPGFLSVLPIY